MGKRTIFKNATILTMDKSDRLLKNYDMAVTDKRISEIQNSVKEEWGDEVIDCTGRLITPGFVDAHLHSCETTLRGMLDNLPLEMWMLYSYPPSDDLRYISDRFAYLRTMTTALEEVRSGVTCAQDDNGGTYVLSLDEHNQICQAYSDIGIKANVSYNVMGKDYTEIVPYMEELPEELRSKLLPPPSIDAAVDLYEELIRAWNGRNDIKIFVSHSAPQRCDDNFSRRLFELAEKHDLPFHSHVCETRVQRVTGFEFYGETIVQHAARIGILSPRTTLAHGVWLDDEDIHIVGKTGTNIAHNVVGNLKLGSGIMQYSKMKEAGVHLALGTDGTASNDSQNFMEVMKYAALIHKVPDPDFNQWPNSGDILEMATHGGARSVMREERIGSLEVGKDADFLIFDMEGISFTPLNNIRNQLVYCAGGNDILDVYVNGKAVMKDRRIQNVNEEAILAEYRELHKEFLKMYEPCQEYAEKYRRYIEHVYWRCINKFKGF